MIEQVLLTTNYSSDLSILFLKKSQSRKGCIWLSEDVMPLSYAQTEFGSKIHHHKTSLWCRTILLIPNMVKAAGELLVLWPDLPYSLGSHWFLWSGEEGCPQDKLSKDATVLAQLFPVSSKGKAPITSSEKIRLINHFRKPFTKCPVLKRKGFL